MSEEPVVSGVPFRVVVEEGKVHEFAAATKSTSRDHHRERDPVSPVTFLMSSVFWQTPDADPWTGRERNVERILHGEQSFVFHGPPPRAGTVLMGQQRIDRVYTKDGRRAGPMTFIDVVTEFRDTQGVLVAEMKTTSIETSKPPGARPCPWTRSTQRP